MPYTYLLYCPPFELPYTAMTRKQAEANLAYFVEQIPYRVKQLQLVLECDGEHFELDLDPSSVRELGRWFSKQIEIEPKPAGQLLADELAVDERYRAHLRQWQLTAKTISLCYDIGMYLALQLSKTIPHLSWRVGQGGRNNADYNMPVLASPNARRRFNPIRVSTSVAYNYAEGNAGPERLLEILDVWHGSFRTSELEPE